MSYRWDFDKGSRSQIVQLEDLGLYKGYKIWLHVGKGIMVTIPNVPPQYRPLTEYFTSVLLAKEAIDTLPPPPPWIKPARKPWRPQRAE